MQTSDLRSGATINAVRNYSRQLVVADRLADEAQLRGIPPDYVWFVTAGMTLTEVQLRLNRARAAELLNPDPRP